MGLQEELENYISLDLTEQVARGPALAKRLLKDRLEFCIAAAALIDAANDYGRLNCIRDGCGRLAVYANKNIPEVDEAACERAEELEQKPLDVDRAVWELTHRRYGGGAKSYGRKSA